MADTASTSILNPDPHTNDLSDLWKSFLSVPAVGLSANVVPSASRRDVALTFSGDLTNLQSLSFSSANNLTDFQHDAVDVPDSVITGLGVQASDSWTIGLGSALELLGVRAKGSKSIPSDDGRSTVQTSSSTDQSFVGFIVSCLTEDLRLKLSSTSDARNAVWLSPGNTLRTDVVLTLVSEDVSAGQNALAAIQNNLNPRFSLSLGSLQLSNLVIIARRTCRGIRSTNVGNSFGWDITTTYRITFSFTLGAVVLWATLEPSGLSFTITPTKTASIGDLLDLAGLSIVDTVPVLDNVLDSIEPLQLTVGKDFHGSTWFRVTLTMQWGDAKVYFHYESASATFSAGLVLKGFYATADDKLLTTYNAGDDIDLPSGTEDPPPYYDIRKMSDEMKVLPDVLPTAIALAEIAYDKASKTLWLTAKLINPPLPSGAQQAGKSVPSPFTWDELDVTMMKGSGTFSCAASAIFTIESPSGLEADMGLSVAYNGSSWEVAGYAQGLSGALLADFFDPDFKDPLVAVLGKLSIPSLQVMYTYEKGDGTNPGSASSFAFLGLVDIGLLQLRVFYQYTSSTLTQTAAADALKNKVGSKATNLPDTAQKPKPLDQQGTPNTSWRFECDLEASQPGQTIGTVIGSIADEAAALLPDFVANISFPTADSTQGRNLVAIKVDNTSDGSIFFAFRVTISAFTLTFAQIAYATATKKNTKRMLRFSADKIPLLNKNTPSG